MSNPGDPIVLPTDTYAQITSKLNDYVQVKTDPPGVTITAAQLGQRIGAKWGNAVDDTLLALWKRTENLSVAGVSARVDALEASQTAQDGSITANQAAITALQNDYAPKASPIFTGSPQAPTPPNGDSSSRVATTAWVQANGGGGSNGAPLDSPAFTGTPTAPTPPPTNDSTRIATTEWITNRAYAPLSSPSFNGIPTVPTPSPTNDSGQIANTEWVQNRGYAPKNSPIFTGLPQAPTPSQLDNNTFIATTAYVKTATASLAPIASPNFTGFPQAPTPAAASNDESVATTAFVKSVVSGGSSTNARWAGVVAGINAWSPVQCYGPEDPGDIPFVACNGVYMAGAGRYVYDGPVHKTPRKGFDTDLGSTVQALGIAKSDGSRHAATVMKIDGTLLSIQTYSQDKISPSYTYTLNGGGLPLVKQSKQQRQSTGTQRLYFLVDHFPTDYRYHLFRSQTTITSDRTPSQVVARYTHIFNSGSLAHTPHIDGRTNNVLVGRGPKVWFSSNAGVSFTEVTDFNGNSITGEIEDLSCNYGYARAGVSNAQSACFTVRESGTSISLYYSRDITDPYTKFNRLQLQTDSSTAQCVALGAGMYAVRVYDYITLIRHQSPGLPVVIPHKVFIPGTGISTLTCGQGFSWPERRLVIAGRAQCWISGIFTEESFRS